MPILISTCVVLLWNELNIGGGDSIAMIEGINQRPRKDHRDALRRVRKWVYINAGVPPKYFAFKRAADSDIYPKIIWESTH
jgi:hypothetical protein